MTFLYKMATNKIFIYLDGKIKPPKDLNLTNKLNEIRDILKGSLSNNFAFLSGNDEVPKNDENDWVLKDIVITQNDKTCLNLKTKVIQTIADDFAAPVQRASINVKARVNQLNKNQDEIEKKTNVVIKGSKKIRTKKNEKAKSGDEDSDDESKNSIELDIYQYPIIEFSEEEKKKL